MFMYICLCQKSNTNLKNSTFYIYFFENYHICSTPWCSYIIWIILLTKYNEYNILATYYKCIAYNVTLIYSEYCNKEGISTRNKFTCKDYQACKASIVLAKLSESIILTVSSGNNKRNENENTGASKINKSLSLIFSK